MITCSFVVRCVRRTPVGLRRSGGCVGTDPFRPTLCEIPSNMTTKRASLRKGRTSNTKTVAKSSDTRAKRKAATAKKTAAAAASAEKARKDKMPAAKKAKAPAKKK